ncbi:hypothetical protein AQUCO_03900007v1 [Aquilegia coerulea]|uniref:Patatin n=1 Tax=Aquilegia coerulea TaxID=218851 RepID=A0A2G5CRC3_AQUCA|nr:hypothetical protein AQUCO_03900007v1 [Aquilegia coerulea]
MAMNSFLDNESYDVDKLTHDIFALLENKFLFGSSIDGTKHSVSEKTDFKHRTIVDSLSKNDAGKVRILSIDGGGSTDGVLAAKSLVFLETSLCQKYGNPNARIADFFDVAAGSGVGGILAALLFTRGKDGRPMFTANDALQFLVKSGGRLVPSSKKNGVFRQIFRSASKTEKLFRQLFGESTMKDTVKPVLIPCYDLSTRAPFLFSRTDALENDSYDFKISDVCSATTADPTGAGAFQLSSVDNRTNIVAVDGGLTMNNPTAAAITHVLNNKDEFPFCNSVEDLLVVSLGNGVSDSGCQGQTLSRANIIRIGGEGASDMVDESVSMAFGGNVTSNYVRIQANGAPKKNRNELVELAEKMLTQKNVESILFRGKKVAEKTNKDKLNWFAGELIKEHERRKSSIFPTVMFKQLSPRTSSATVSTIFSC